jgi:signal transduction histidine kinase
VERQLRQLTRFVDELLDVSRLRASQLTLELGQVDLAAVTREVAARLSPELSRSGSQLTVRAGGEVVGLWDRVRLDQLVVNLLDNAIKFGLGKPIEISVDVDGEDAVLVVRDHGIGIAPQRIGAVFDPFERAVSPRHYGGLGLGLYLSRCVVEAQGGTITVESVPGQGSTFTVRLPRTERTPQPAAA